MNQKFFEKKYISESNTVNNMKLMILKKIKVIHTCSSSQHAASVFYFSELCGEGQMWRTSAGKRLQGRLHQGVHEVILRG